MTVRALSIVLVVGTACACDPPVALDEVDPGPQRARAAASDDDGSAAVTAGRESGWSTISLGDVCNGVVEGTADASVAPRLELAECELGSSCRELVVGGTGPAKFSRPALRESNGITRIGVLFSDAGQTTATIQTVGEDRLDASYAVRVVEDEDCVLAHAVPTGRGSWLGVSQISERRTAYAFRDLDGRFTSADLPAELFQTAHANDDLLALTSYPSGSIVTWADGKVTRMDRTFAAIDGQRLFVLEGAHPSTDVLVSENGGARTVVDLGDASRTVIQIFSDRERVTWVSGRWSGDAWTDLALETAPWGLLPLRGSPVASLEGPVGPAAASTDAYVMGREGGLTTVALATGETWDTATTALGPWTPGVAHLGSEAAWLSTADGRVVRVSTASLMP